MFIQLHGNMAVANIKRKQALEYRRALQEAPRLRKGELLRATLPAQAAWGREHPEEPKITAATINKQLGGVRSVCVWANENGLISDDVQWSDPFSKLRLPEERSERTSFEIAELQKLFSAPVFTEHDFALGAHGDAGFWLPILALFTGARQAELGSRSRSRCCRRGRSLRRVRRHVQSDEAAGAGLRAKVPNRPLSQCQVLSTAA
jgi:hypothetical protein